MRKSQWGASYLGVFLGIIVFALVLKAAVAVAPVYWDDRIINNQIDALMRESPRNIAVDKFVTQMNQRLDMNSVRDVRFNEIAKVTNKGGLRVSKQYEVRRPFLFNIDLVIKFEKNFEQNAVQAQ
ncbi:DUF4845 domain-containing protein [Acinetobacter soli]|uniref:DUF4845 domain-containing protein n=1 Tax=Acinetobacter soli TaxID=487316 RepID=A0AB38YSS0_9GAMM|nr:MULTISPECIES: DUF4845 domain-containing protein [Acinetobacter]KQC99162.1 hypothetical protein APD01_08840 [Acinetobacter soli]MBO3670689.1 DUF4845 domain-containing protein [Acinetobacter soli]MBV6552020.1 DUF4845 domain-containing protein [Acinetobacter soli]MDQ8941939.1 DUF4845 domain-containing protein [Acinetobacter soli]MEB4800438.1 DUF4845 domain-containing protein [Acinetobacter soli]